MKNFENILQQIEKEDIKPLPKWYFTSKNIVFWLSFLLMSVLGSVAFAIVLFSIQQADFQLLSHFKHSKIETVLTLIPYFWLSGLFLFTILGIFSFSKFKKSYKFSIWHIVEVNIVISAIMGTLVFLSNGAQFLERKFADTVPSYVSIEEQKTQHWMQPDKGFLAGKIVSSKTDTLYIIDFYAKKWHVYYHDIFIPPVLKLQKNVKIKIMGNKLTDSTFQANQLRPWRAFEAK